MTRPRIRHAWRQRPRLVVQVAPGAGAQARPTLNEEERAVIHISNNEQDADEQVMQLTGG